MRFGCECWQCNDTGRIQIIGTDANGPYMRNELCSCNAGKARVAYERTISEQGQPMPATESGNRRA